MIYLDGTLEHPTRVGSWLEKCPKWGKKDPEGGYKRAILVPTLGDGVPFRQAFKGAIRALTALRPMSHIGQRESLVETAEDAAPAVGWDEQKVIEDGIVSVRDLSHHTTQVLKAVEKSGRPLLVSRQNKIVAFIAPTNLRQVLNQGIDPDLQEAMKLAETTLDNMRTVSASNLTRD